MPQTVSIGYQDFETIRKNNYFYIDKTKFIREWWERGDSVTLITRPRRFGKTLTLSMVENFFSMNAANRGELFEGLSGKMKNTGSCREPGRLLPLVSRM